VFYKLWEDQWGPWLQLILQNVLWVFIENPQYCLTELPLFLNPRKENQPFRNHILSNVKLNPACVDFWKYEFFERREHSQQERADAALTRINTLLTHPYVRHIVGQQVTTLDFAHIMENHIAVLFKLSANLPDDIKKFIGTILVSELLHAVRNRPEGYRWQFNIFVDEFQNFASSDDFRALITEGRKFNVSITVCHQERFGQFADQQKLMGATLAAANKVVFQATVIDSKELAPEFAKAPTVTETRLEPELVITPDPFWDLMRRGHANPKIAEYVRKYWWPIQALLERKKDEMETIRLQRGTYQDQATLFRDQASLSQTDEREEARFGAMARGRAIPFNYSAIDRTRDAVEQTRNAHLMVAEQNEELLYLQKGFAGVRKRIDSINACLTALMQGEIDTVSGYDLFANFLLCMMVNLNDADTTQNLFYDGRVIQLYTFLHYGDPQIPLELPGNFRLKHWPEEVETVHLQKHMEWYLGWRQEYERSVEERRRLSPHSPFSQLPEESYFTSVFTRTKNEWLQELHAGERDIGGGEMITVFRPDLPARVYRGRMREVLLILCRNDMQESIQKGTSTKTLFQIFDELADLCSLLQQPENHIKIASGQYVEKQIHVRPVHDMTDEMAQELSNLPRFTAYAKLLQVTENVRTFRERTRVFTEQIVWKGKIQTLPLPPLTIESEKYATLLGQNLSKKRTEVEAEIRERQEPWRRVAAAQTPTPAQPPPTSEPPPTSD